MQPVAYALSGVSDRDLMNALVQEFGELFTEPRGIPPKRHYDHQIYLVARMNAVAVCPYRYR